MAWLIGVSPQHIIATKHLNLCQVLLFAKMERTSQLAD
jgi:hypothetical protein